MGAKFTTDSPQDTGLVAKKLADSLRAGDVLALTGTLGAGKTTFVQHLASALHSPDYVTSPTFTLINHYGGDIPLYHIDLYRLEFMEESEDIGIEEYLPSRDGVTLLEWADKFPEILPEEYISITITYVSENRRNITVEGHGQKYKDITDRLALK